MGCLNREDTKANHEGAKKTTMDAMGLHGHEDTKATHDGTMARRHDGTMSSLNHEGKKTKPRWLDDVMAGNVRPQRHEGIDDGGRRRRV